MNRSIAVIIGDSAYSARMMELALRKWRFNVVSTNVPIGLADVVSAYRPALVVVDEQMPGVDCPALVRALREDPDLRSTTVLIHSALEEPSLVQRVAECRADGYVMKSRDIGAIERQLKAWLPR